MKKLLFCAILSLCVNASTWAQDYKIDLIDISSVAVDEASVKRIDGKIHMHIHNVDKALAGTMPNAIVADSIYSQAVKDNLGKLLSQIKTRMGGNDVEFVKLYMQCSENLQQQLQITQQGQDSVQVSDHQIVQCVVEYYLSLLQVDRK